jgi:glycosyltransferase involved in cell wall biosynthesis
VDDTRAVVGGWAKKKLKPEGLTLEYIFQPNRGAAAARNAGLIRSKGEFIQYAGSDDVLVPDKLSEQVYAIRETNCDFVWSAMKVIKAQSDQLSLAEKCRKPGDLYFLDQHEMPDSDAVGLYRRNLCVELGPWDERLACHQDVDYRYRCESLRVRRAYVPGEFYIAVEHEGSRINDKYNSAEGARAKLRVLDNARAYSRRTGAHLDLYGRCFLALFTSLANDQGDLISRSFQILEEEAKGQGRKFMVRSLSSIHKLFGASVTLKAIKVYGKLRAVPRE